MIDSSPAFTQAARSGAVIWGAQMAAYLGSFVLGVAMAARFGAGGATDAYFMASSTAELLTKLLLGGALVSVLLPVLVKLRTQGTSADANTVYSTLFTLAVVSFVVLGGALELAARPLVSFLAPGFSEEAQRLTLLLLRVSLPAYLFSFLADLLIVPLHAERRFALPAMSRLVVPFLTLLFLLALAGIIGVTSLALGTLVGTSVQIVILVRALWTTGTRLRPSFAWRHPAVRRVLRLTLPFVISVLAAQGAGIVYRVLVSHAPEGSLASLKFSEKIYLMTNTLFLGSIAQVAFPIFAKAAATSDTDARARLRTAVRMVVFLALPLTVGMVLLGVPLVRALYERGAFNHEATLATAAVLPLYLVGLLGNGLSSLLGHLVLAYQDTRTSVAVTVALQTIVSALFVLLTPWLGIVTTLAAVSGFGPFLLTALYLFAVRKRLPHLWRTFLDPSLARIILAAAACGPAVLLVRRAVSASTPTLLNDLLTLLSAGLTGALLYAGVAWLLRVPEVELVGALARRGASNLARWRQP